jgi:cell division protein FtsQ
LNVNGLEVIRQMSRGISGRAVGAGVALVAVLLVLSIAPSAEQFNVALADFFPVASVRVEGDLQYIEPQQFEQAVMPWVRGSYFTLNLPGVARAAKSMAWVDVAEVERLWPDAVVLRLREQRPIARWGEAELLNVRGERFAPAQVARFSSLPYIDAPPGTEVQLMSTISKLNAELRSTGETVARISLSKRHAWFVTLSNGMEINFGRQDPVAAFQRFMGLVSKLGESKFNELLRLDLRYPSGFSLVWKPGVADQASSPDAAGV